MAYEEASHGCCACYRLYSVVTEKQLPRETPAGHREPIFPE